jgi:tetratricopeptide (TPR) repeat protein
MEPANKESEIDLEAFKFYQHGQSMLKENYIYRNTILESRKQFQKASTIDPNWSAPYVGMAESFLLELHYGYNIFERVRDSLEYYVERASAINPDQGELYCLKGSIAFWTFDFKEALNQFDKAIEINPNYPWSYYFKGYLYVISGDLEKGISLIDKASSLDPLNETYKTIKPLLYSLSGKQKEAEKMLLEMLEKEPGENTTLFMLGMVYSNMKEYDKAINTLLKRSVGQTTNPILAFNYAKSGQMEKAREILDYLLQIPEDRSPPSSMMAIVYLGFEDYDKALDYIEKGFNGNDLWFIWIDQSWSEPIKDDPSYKRILEAYQKKLNNI